MTEAEKRTPQEIAAAIHETVRTLNEHLEEAYQAGLIASVETFATHTMNSVDRIRIAASVAQKL